MSDEKRCTCGNSFDGDNFCMPSACQWEGLATVPRPLDTAYQESVCPQTLRGWLWYCHEHDSHGNADSEEEAEMVAGAHEMFWQTELEDEDEDDEDSPCDIIVWMRMTHERVT